VKRQPGTFLAEVRGGTVDEWVEVGVDRRPRCRMLAWRVPQEAAQKRRERLFKKARKKGRKASAAQRASRTWAVYTTDAPARLTSRFARPRQRRNPLDTPPPIVNT
jgi:hypothetical protein